MREVENPYISILKVFSALWLALVLVLLAGKAYSAECWLERDLWVDDQGQIQSDLNIYCDPTLEDELPTEALEV